MNKPAKPDAILLGSHVETYDRNSLRLTAQVVAIDPTDHKPRNYTDGPYAGLQAHAYVDATVTTSAGGTYGWSVQYDRLSRVELADAKAMYTTLARIDRHMTAASDRLGYPTTFGQFVLRFADALGVRRFVLCISEPTGWYKTGDYVDRNAQFAASWFDEQATKFIAAHSVAVR